jgi:hypothetical protein
MLSLFTAAAGYWLCQHVGIYRTEQGTDNLEFRTQEIAADLIRLWLTFLSICTFTLTAGRTARRFVDSVLLPWLAAFGLNVPALPSLPHLPTQDHLTA